MRRVTSRGLLPGFVLLAALYPLGCQAQPAPSGGAASNTATLAGSSNALAEAAATITERTVLDHLMTLASDELRGRNTPSPGLDAAAAYLEARYREFGVTPGAGDGNFIQRYPFRGAQPPNVLAMIPGRDPELRDEYIVVSAHLDHVGVGNPVNGDSIYNGADDNASGTTAILEVARVLASLPESERPRRSILIAHVSGEEYGLLGSRYWVENPTVPIEQVVANINADMVGGDLLRDTVAVIGVEYSTLGSTIREVNARLPELNLQLTPDLWPQQRYFFRSDQLNFMQREIPAIFLFNGEHECYHQPCDEVGFVNKEKIARVARLLAHTVMEIANREEAPAWHPEGLAEVRRMVGGR